MYIYECVYIHMYISKMHVEFCSLSIKIIEHAITLYFICFFYQKLI